MESARRKALEVWLKKECRLPSFSLVLMVGDASFRRYFRVKTPSGSFVAMDAPTVQENCHSFVKISRVLRSLGLIAPEVIHADINQGFLLLTDFGDITYLSALNVNNADRLYDHAMNALATLQGCRKDIDLPIFDGTFMWQEWEWCKEWFLNKFLGIKSISAELDECFKLLIESAQSQPQVFAHRDYHSANLMVFKDSVGILDFQDAFIGPISYDLVSLLRDCYIDWPNDKVRDWSTAYLSKLQAVGSLSNVSPELFMRWFDLMGVQRHLKALFTFARKYVRDHQQQYLKHIPRTMQYLLNVTQNYAELTPLRDFLVNTVQPILKKNDTLCVQ